MGLTKKRTNPDLKMQHLDGRTGEVQSEMEGGERIFSREDTEILMALAKEADSPEGLVELGEAVYSMIDTQRNTQPEYAEE
jgi:hypothetical protein